MSQWRLCLIRVIATGQGKAASGATSDEDYSAEAEVVDTEDEPVGTAATKLLRYWLFDNFLHPYPSQADKRELAEATGLRVAQVGNHFINARVRVWRPSIIKMANEIEQARRG